MQYALIIIHKCLAFNYLTFSYCSEQAWQWTKQKHAVTIQALATGCGWSGDQFFFWWWLARTGTRVWWLDPGLIHFVVSMMVTPGQHMSSTGSLKTRGQGCVALFRIEWVYKGCLKKTATFYIIDSRYYHHNNDILRISS